MTSTLLSHIKALNKEKASLTMRVNVTLVYFNPLPTWPLDGGKILYLLYHLRLPF